MLKRILKYLLIGIAACYIVFAFIVVPNIPDNSRCKGVLISVTNDKNGNLTNGYIMEMLQTSGIDPSKKEMDSISCRQIEELLKGITLIKECQVYKGTTGFINVDIECRTPILQVYEMNGQSYYIDANGDSIIGIMKALHLPIANGYITKEMRKKELKEIANTIYNDPFWLAQIEQIHFDKKGGIILVPRVGNHIIEFGTADNATEKLSKLYTFYSKGLNTIGWDKYEKLNIEFNDKVIGTKKNK